MAGASSIFAGDKLLTTPNPDINEDMKLFKILGLKGKAPFVDGEKPVSNDNYKNVSFANGSVKWSRPGHKIEGNEIAKAKAKSIRKDLAK